MRSAIDSSRASHRSKSIRVEPPIEPHLEEHRGRRRRFSVERRQQHRRRRLTDVAAAERPASHVDDGARDHGDRPFEHRFPVVAHLRVREIVVLSKHVLATRVHHRAPARIVEWLGGDEGVAPQHQHGLTRREDGVPFEEAPCVARCARWVPECRRATAMPVANRRRVVCGPLDTREWGRITKGRGRGSTPPLMDHILTCGIQDHLLIGS